ncbi:MAG: hypothetical protein CMJ84_16935 [Planctomycetes bacterium]|nr:hypothetical protein [Planctomycetota bacterium]MDP6408814.1 FG-GAP-like repeat-containing protein [Planctomycetota bacterium]
MDYDADGDIDVLSGSYTGEIYLFERSANGELAQGRYLEDEGGGVLQTGNSVTPEAVDVDGDDDLDLVIGTRSSGVFVVINRGTRAEPRWAGEPVLLKTRDGSRIEGSNAHHADWDGDGVRDLIVGSERGGAGWHRNLGSNDTPAYGEAADLVARLPFEEREEADGPVAPGSRTKVHVSDWNGDGLADLLIGDVQWLWETLPPLTAEQEARKAEIEPEYEALSDAYETAVAERNSYVGKPGGIPEEALALYRAAWDALKPLSREMASFERRKPNTHGWVWLYLRAGPATSEGVEAAADEQPQGATTHAGSAREPRVRQVLGPATLELFARPVSAAEPLVRLRLVLSLERGWHVYESVPAPSAYRAFEPRLDLPAGVEQAREWRSESFGVPSRTEPGATWFVDEAVFTCELRLSEPTGGEVAVTLDLQVCDDRVCLPPKTARLSLGKVTREAGSRALRLGSLDAMLPRFIKRWLPSPGSSILTPGAEAPEFTLTDDRGVARSSTDFAGERYLLWFYPMAGTPG